jgi:anaerobic magnesium-protoporphyrin IX monomethyl ester cyclase
MTDVAIVQLPSPPRKNVFREWSGGMGTALASAREGWGHDQQFYDIPFSAYLYIARRLEQAGIPFHYRDFQGSERLDLDEYDAMFRKERPRVLVTQVNLPSLEHDLQLVERAKQAAPGLRVILVGATGKWFKERILRDGLADMVMEEAEELLVSENVAALLGDAPHELQGGSVWRDGALVSLPALTRMKSLDFVDFPAYELLDFARYESDYYLGRRYRYATVFTTKGCPYRCGYCPYPYGFGRKLIYRSPEVVGADIERLQREFGVEQILFRDQVFTINPKHAQAVCEELIRRDLGVVWVCETRYDLVDEALLALMHRAGCREVHFGLESGDEAMFAQVAKSDGPQSLALFEQAVGWAREAGLRVHLHCIVGMPDESWQSVRNTTKFLRRTKPDSVQLAYFVPYPGTPFFDELSKSGELGDLGKLDWEDLGSFTGPVLPSRHMTTDEIRRARHRISVDWHYTLADRVLLKLRRTIGLAPAPAAKAA